MPKKTIFFDALLVIGFLILGVWMVVDALRLLVFLARHLRYL